MQTDRRNVGENGQRKSAEGGFSLGAFRGSLGVLLLGRLCVNRHFLRRFRASLRLLPFLLQQNRLPSASSAYAFSVTPAVPVLLHSIAKDSVADTSFFTDSWFFIFISPFYILP